MTQDPPKEYVGRMPVEVQLAGETYKVSPITMGQLHQLKQVFRNLNPPQPVKVEVEGLVRAMLQGPDDPAPGNGPIPGLRQFEAGKTREMIRDTVLQAVREARGRVEQWPPDPTSPMGQDLIANDPEVQKQFLLIVLQKHHPDLTSEQAAAILSDCDVTEYEELIDAAFRTVRDRNKRLLEEQLSDPKLAERLATIQALNSSASGGGGVGSPSFR